MERARLVHVGIAVALAGAILVETYALFDEDLGTPVPVFHEFSCRGALEVVATDGFGRPDLTVPLSGLNATARSDGRLVPAYFIAYLREAGGEWVLLPPPVRDDRGWHVFIVESVTVATEAYVVARDISGERCEGTSEVIGAVEREAPQPPTPVTPTVEPTPEPTREPPASDVFPPCGAIALAARDEAAGDALGVPRATVRAELSPVPPGNATYTLYVSEGGAFEARETVEAAGGRARFELETTNATMAFVHVDFRPTVECAKDSRVLRAG